MRDRPSDTALLIAESIVQLRSDPATAALVPPETEALARAAMNLASPRLAPLRRALFGGALSWFTRAAEALVLPGIQLHYAARKRFIEEAVFAALDDGSVQLIVIAAGFDALAIRAANRPDRPVCFEVDHPATQALKRRAVERANLEPRELRFVPVDLARAGPVPALSRAAFDAEARSCFVMEGVSMYLEEDAVLAVLRSCARKSPPGSRFVWTFMEPDERGRIAFRRSRASWVNSWLAARGEPFRWGIGPERLEAFLALAGWELVEVARADLLRERYLAPVGLADRPVAAGESICIARRP